MQKKFEKLYLSKIKQIHPEYKHKKVNALYNKKLSLNEIFDSGVENSYFSEQFRRKKIKLMNSMRIK